MQVMQAIREAETQEQAVLENLPRDVEVLFQMADESNFKLPSGLAEFASALGLGDQPFACQSAARYLTSIPTLGEIQRRIGAADDLPLVLQNPTMAMSGVKYFLGGALLSNIYTAGMIVKNNHDNVHAGTLIQLASELIPAALHLMLYREISALRDAHSEVRHVNSLAPPANPSDADVKRHAALVRVVQRRASELVSTIPSQLGRMVLSTAFTFSSFALLTVAQRSLSSASVSTAGVLDRRAQWVLAAGLGAGAVLTTREVDRREAERIAAAPTTPEQIATAIESADAQSFGAEQVLAAAVLAHQSGRPLSAVASHLLGVRLDQMHAQVVALRDEGLLHGDSPANAEIERATLTRIPPGKLERAQQKLLQMPALSQ